MFEYSKVFSIKDKISYKNHQIISKRIFQDDQVTFYLFSFDEDESVSEQSNTEDILIYVLDGEMQVFQEEEYTARQGELLAIKRDTLHRVYSKVPSKILQISTVTNKGENMENFIKKINSREVLKIGDSVDYEGNGVSSLALVQRSSFTLTIMAFSKGSKIASHSSTGDALVQILEGTAKIDLDGETFTVNAGESILMPAEVPHALHAEEQFKMLLTVAKPE